MTSYAISSAESENQFTEAYKQIDGLVGQLNDPESQKQVARMKRSGIREGLRHHHPGFRYTASGLLA